MRKTIQIHLTLAFLVLCTVESRAQNFWQPTIGPYGGNILSLVVDGNNRIFAATDGAGIFRSTDNGASWTAVNVGLSEHVVFSLAVDVSGTVFAGTTAHGIFRSTDHGDTWIAGNRGLTDLEVRAIAVSGRYIFVGTWTAGVFRSDDNGLSWMQVAISDGGEHVQTIAVSSTGTVLVGTDISGVFRSTDNGDTWYSSILGLTDLGVTAIAMVTPSIVYAATYNGGVFTSADSGKSWKASGPIAYGDVRALAINSSGNVYAGTPGQGVYRSTDKGQTWQSLNMGLDNMNVQALALSSSAVFAGTRGGGIYKSSIPGGVWATANNGLMNAFVYSLASNASGHMFAGTGGAGILRSTDLGDTWVAVKTDLMDNYFTALAINSKGHIFAGTGSAGVFRSTDNGLTWVEVNAWLTDPYINTLAIGRNGDIYAGTWGGYVFRSADNGNGWSPAGSGNDAVLSLVVSPTGTLFAGTTGGGIFWSKNYGYTWDSTRTRITTYDVRSMACDSAGNVFAGISGSGVYRSMDKGMTWGPVNNGLTDLDVQSVIVNPSGHLFAGTYSNGVFRSTNNGDSWKAVNTGFLPGGVLLSMAVTPSGYVFAGMYGLGVYRTMQSTVSATAPTVTTSAASAITSTSATLNAKVNPNGSLTKVYFEFAKIGTLTNPDSTTPQWIGSGAAPVDVSTPVTGFVPGITYFFRAVAQNLGGTQRGMIMSFATLAARDYYVNATTGSNTTGNGTQISPWKTITYALNQISSPGSTLNVAAGTYNTALGETFPILMKDGISFAGAGIDVAILDAQTTNTVIRAVGITDPTTTVKGFTIQGGGNSNQGGGLMISAGSVLKVDGCKIKGNTVSSATSAKRYGGGIYIFNSSPTIVNCEISGNTVTATRAPTDPSDFGAYGAGVAIVGISSPRLLQNIIRDNEAQNSSGALASGAGVYVAGLASPLLDGNTISRNTLRRLFATSGITLGAGISIENSGGVFTGNTIANNGIKVDYGSPTTSSGIYIAGSLSKPKILRNLVVKNTDHGIWSEITATPTIVNNTIVENTGDGIYLLGATPDSIVNNIFALNSNYGIREGSTSSDPGKVWYNLFYANTTGLYQDEASLVYNSASTLNTVVPECKNNLDGDPLFVDRVNGDYRLRFGSPAVNAGDPGTPLDPDGTRADIGALYYVPVTAVPSAPSLSSPSNGASSQSTTPTLTWSTSAGATQYHLQVSTTSAFAAFVVNDSSLTGTSRSVGPLANGTLHYWRVRAGSSSGWSSYSGSWSFTTLSSPPVVSTSAAANVASASATLNGSVNPNGSATTAWFEWGTSSTLTSSGTTSPQSIGSGTSPVSVTDSLKGLAPNTTYYYRVVGQNVGGQSNGSIVSFSTLSTGVLTAPSLASPADGATGVSTSPTVSWTVSTTAISYQLQVSSNSGFTSTTIDQVGITAGSYQLNALASNTMYYWRVNAKYASGTSGWSSVWSFTTAIEVPSAPSLVLPANGALNQSIPLTLSWSAVTGALTYRLQVDKTTAFTAPVYDNSALSTTSQLVSSLQNGTTYYWRVSATSAGGTSAYSSTYNFTTIVAAPAAPTLSTPGNTLTGFSAPLTLTWVAPTGAATYHVQLSINSGYNAPLVLDDSSVSSSSRLISTLAQNATYYWRVRGKNTVGYGGWSASFSFSTVATKPVTSLVASFPASPSASTDYRLVSFPGTSSLNIGQVLTGAQNTDWRMFRDNGATEPNNLAELASSSSLSPGEGYWLVTKGAFNFSNTLTMPQLGTDGAYTMNVRNGWNIIGNPFDVAVAWGVVKADNSSNATLWTYAGPSGYQSSTMLEPFKGYYFNSTSTSLKIRYPFPSMTVVSVPSPVIDWKLQIALETEGNHDSENYIGMAPTAKKSLDELDQRKPPRFLDQAFLSLSLPAPNGEEQYLSSDFRPSSGEGQVWNFLVSNPKRANGRIRIIGIESVPPALEVVLIDAQNTVPVDLRVNSQVVFRNSRERQAFHLIVGDKDFVRTKEAQLIPKEFELSQNYPNPFNPSTTITYKIPRVATVRLEIVSLLGQHLETLAEGTHTPGTYSVVWSTSGQHASSGVYFARLLVDGKVMKIQKMTFLK